MGVWGVRIWFWKSITVLWFVYWCPSTVIGSFGNRNHGLNIGQGRGGDRLCVHNTDVFDFIKRACITHVFVFARAVGWNSSTARVRNVWRAFYVHEIFPSVMGKKISVFNSIRFSFGRMCIYLEELSKSLRCITHNGPPPCIVSVKFNTRHTICDRTVLGFVWW